jgi:zinc transporter, ZIP family
MQQEILIPILITVAAGLCTGIGSVAALFVKQFKHTYLSVMLGFSAGVMVYVAFVDLLGKSIAEIGLMTSNLCFFGGILVIAFIERFIPHAYLGEEDLAFPADAPAEKMRLHHHHGGRRFRGGKASDQRRLMNAGLMTAAGIAIHNFPEGMAVLFTSVHDLTIGASLGVAIALHNIPEGIAVAMPVYYATGDRKKAFLYSFFSGVTEPIGAVIGYLLIGPFLTESVLMGTLSAVAGIMVFISFDELLPISFSHGEEHIAILGLLIGMAVMALSLSILV